MNGSQLAGMTLGEFIVISLLILGCSQQRPDEPVIPKGFDTSLLSVLACPENLTPLHLATSHELESVRERIKHGTVKHWDGTPVSETVDGLLIRADGKIAYVIQNATAVMLIDKAIVMDESVGKPEPNKYRKRK